MNFPDKRAIYHKVRRIPKRVATIRMFRNQPRTDAARAQTQAATRRAPARLNASASASSVLPVVITSSISATSAPASADDTLNARLTFRRPARPPSNRSVPQSHACAGNCCDRAGSEMRRHRSRKFHRLIESTLGQAARMEWHRKDHVWKTNPAPLELNRHDFPQGTRVSQVAVKFQAPDHDAGRLPVVEDRHRLFIRWRRLQAVAANPVRRQRYRTARTGRTLVRQVPQDIPGIARDHRSPGRRAHTGTARSR
jgi:hypothetical protein